jgi:hypothetical protein
VLSRRAVPPKRMRPVFLPCRPGLLPRRRVPAC